MTEKELISVRLESDTLERVESYADEHDVSRSVAIRRLLDTGADIEQTDLAAVVSHSATESDETPVTDGGPKPVARPALNFVAGVFATVVMLGMGLILSGPPLALQLPYLSILTTVVTSSLLLAGSTILLYTELPEKADRKFRLYIPLVETRDKEVIQYERR